MPAAIPAAMPTAMPARVVRGMPAVIEGAVPGGVPGRVPRIPIPGRPVPGVPGVPGVPMPGSPIPGIPIPGVPGPGRPEPRIPAAPGIPVAVVPGPVHAVSPCGGIVPRGKGNGLGRNRKGVVIVLQHDVCCFVFRNEDGIGLTFLQVELRFAGLARKRISLETDRVAGLAVNRFDFAVDAVLKPLGRGRTTPMCRIAAPCECHKRRNDQDSASFHIFSYLCTH